MRKQTNRVILTPEQESRLRTIGYTGTHPVRQIIHARALLRAAAGQADAEIAEALEIALGTVFQLRKCFVEQGMEACLKRKEQQNRARKITGDIEARIVQIACTEPPAGRAKWTIDLITDRVIELNILPSIGRTAVAKVLKKTKSNRG